MLSFLICIYTYIYILYIYISISIPVNPRYLDCTIASSCLLARRRQLRTLLQLNLQQICAHKHLNALGGIHIFAGITYCSFAAYMVPASWPHWLTLFYRVAGTPFTALSGGGHTQVHSTGFALGQVQISGCQMRSRHMLWSRQRTYIQPIVLQEGVHTILHFA